MNAKFSNKISNAVNGDKKLKVDKKIMSVKIEYMVISRLKC